MTKGRLYAGFARGYQDRWVNVLGQQYHVTGAPMDEYPHVLVRRLRQSP